MLASFRQLVRRCFRRSVLPHRRLSFRPQVEQLESREVPAVYRVTTLTDSDIGSGFAVAGSGSSADPFRGSELTLRRALEDATANHAGENNTVKLTSGKTYTIDRGQLVADLDLGFTLTITTTTSSRATIKAVQGVGNPAPDPFRVLEVTEDTVGKLNNLVLTGGLQDNEGGGILNNGDLTLTNSVVTKNTAFDTTFASGGGISSHGKLTLDNSKVTDNRVGGLDPDDPSPLFLGFGGGIAAEDTLTLRNNSVVSGNFVSGKFAGGGGIALFPDAVDGDSISSTLNITRSKVIGNTALGVSSDSFSFAFGGGIFDNTGNTITIKDSTIADNKALGGDFSAGESEFREPAGNAAGGGFASKFLPFFREPEVGSTISISRSTFSNNEAIGGDGTDDSTEGGDATGGGLAVSKYNSFTMINSTVSGNKALGGEDGDGFGFGPASGGGLAFFNSDEDSTAQLVNVTVTRNQALSGAEGSGGGIFNSGGEGEVILWNTIVAQNFVDAAKDENRFGSDVVGNFISTGVFSGHNLIGNADGSFGFGAPGSGDKAGTEGNVINAKLGPLADNGGPTKTHALLKGSPAIDGGDDAVLGFPFFLEIDQRFKPRKSGKHVDIGAFEVQGGLDNRRWDR